MKRLELIYIYKPGEREGKVLKTVPYTDFTSRDAAFRQIEEFISKQYSNDIGALEVHDVVDVRYPQIQVKVNWAKDYSITNEQIDGEEWDDVDE